MRRLCISAVMTICLVAMSGRVYSQGGSNTVPFPTNPPVGIGTELSTPSGAQNAVHIHYDPAHSQEAILRFSTGKRATTDTLAILGLMHGSGSTYSSLSIGEDLLMHAHRDGDIILTNFWPAGSLTHQTGGSIRFATAGDTSAGHRPNDSTLWRKDYERLKILGNGNVGINLPKDSIPYEQLQLGGGSQVIPGVDPVPGLTFYGGNQYEGMPLTGGTLAHFDFRFIDFNHYHNPWTGAGSRMARMSSSGIGFAPGDSGLIQLGAYPYDSSRGLGDQSVNTILQVSGHTGLQLWTGLGTADPYHHLFDVYRPGVTFWPITRNVNGLCFHHTPVYIGTDTGANAYADFTNFAHINPDMGDGKTWMLVVDGPELAKEVFVLDTVWADFVFDENYKLPSLAEVEQFTKANHHLPGIPSAGEVAKKGVALGETEAKLLQKVEELTLYTIEMKKEMDALKAEINDLKGGGSKP